MDEQETKTNNEEAPVENKDDGVQPKANTFVDDTNLASKRMEEATQAAREERIAAEESYAKMKLGGIAEAGQAPVKKEVSPKEYAEKVMQGDIEGK